MAISIVLDPTEVAGGRVQLDISQWIGPEIDWGDASIEAYMAEAAMGQIPVDYRVPNRVVVIPLILRTMGATSFSTIRTQIQQKISRMQAEGGWLKRTTGLGDVFADVVNAHMKLGGSGFWEDVRGADISAELTLECLPDWYQAEVDLGTTSETTLPEVRKVMTTVKGNYPARTRIVVTDTQGASQHGLIWGLRSENYSAASTNALVYEAEALTPKDAAAIATVSGASGGGSNNAIRHAGMGSLSGIWTPILSTQILSGGAHMTHKGSYRVWARVRMNTPSTSMKLRLLWDVGDLILPQQNDFWEIPDVNQWYLADLGSVYLDPSPVGTHRWQGLIQALFVGSSANPVQVDIDRLFFVPVDDGYGVLRSSSAIVAGINAVAARDAFSQTSGALTGKTLPVGGTWGGAGSATDFQVNASVGEAQRSANSDTTVSNGRFVTAGTTTFTGVQVSANVQQNSGSFGFTNSIFAGLLMRYIDTSNWMAVGRLALTNTTSALAMLITYTGAGTVFVYANSIATNEPAFAAPLIANIGCSVTDSGRYEVTVNGTLKMSGTRSELATGGALASGKVGLYDVCQASTWPQRDYDNFFATPLVADAVVFASQSLEMRDDGMFREDDTGTSYGPVSQVIGDLPRLPTSGLEARSVELFVKGTRGDPGGVVADSAIDDISVQVLCRPAWLFVPEA